ncbi:MAG: S-layer homology domain-containing protein [Oscillospiraceae bacterium]|jgi:hypothetical protein
MKKILARMLSTFLALLVILSCGLFDALAYYVEGADTATGAGLIITDKNGSKVTPNATWESTFPYGTFAFENSEVAVTEGGAEQCIRVYRLGGKTGKATALITYVPAVTEDEEGRKLYSNAISSSDISIFVEDALPITDYQPVGKDPDPERAGISPSVEVGAAANGSAIVTLSLDITADAYQWYTFDGNWKVIEGATDASMVVGAADYNKYDFRCVYTLADVSYSTDSAKGEEYIKPEEEVLGEPPADLELNPEPTYSRLELESAGAYAGWTFALTFAEGEYVKEIRFMAADDAEAECDEYAALTIYDCVGGTVYDSANTLMLHVQDNEEDEPSQVGFSVSDITVDKADGTALLTIERTGGKTKVLTLDYATADGTAKAGTDYIEKSGTVALYADHDTYTIEIELINDGIATDEIKSFTVTLSSLRGDDASVLTNDTVNVNLYNSGETDELNTASIIYDAEAVDVSCSVTMSDTSANSGSEVLKGTQESVGEETVGTVTWEEPGELSPQSFCYGKITFPYNENQAYQSTVNLLNMSWSNGTNVRSKGNASSVYTDTNMPILYSGFSGRFYWNCSFASDWDIFWHGLEYTYPYFYILGSKGLAGYTNSSHSISGSWGDGYRMTWYSTGSYSYDWAMSSGVNRLVLGTSKYCCCDSKSEAVAQLTSGSLYRRVFTGNFNMRIHTSNDSNTAPDGASVFTKDFYSNYYSQSDLNAGTDSPKVTLYGGVDGSKRIYVGSTINVKLGSVASLKPATNDSSYAVYLTDDSTGAVVAVGTGSGSSYSVNLMWGTGMQLDHDYTVNMVLVRNQSVTLNLATSADSEDTDTARAMNDALDRFISSNTTAAADADKYITLGYTGMSKTTVSVFNQGSVNIPEFGSVAEKNIKISEISFSSSTGALQISDNSPLNVSNIQYINFNLSPDDLILINGKSYAGNEKIWLTSADLKGAGLTFYYYHKDYQSKISTMLADIDHVALYYDRNGNGKIDGYWNAEENIFVLDKDSSGFDIDNFISNLDGTKYEETTFEPVVDPDGTVHQYFFKVFFTKNPRCLIVPEGASASDTCQIMPAFITSITDSAAYSKLTTEQKSYRYIVSGLTRTSSTADEGHSSDNHLMYQAQASAMAYVDVPLGGDKSPCRVNAAGNAYEWNPDYEGHLLYPFDNPEPIFIEHSLAGDHIPLAPDTVYGDDGSYTLTTAGKKELNDYLGSFGGNDTYALIIQEQNASTQSIVSGLSTQEDNGSAESVNLGTIAAFPNSEYLQNMSGTTENNSASDGEHNDYSEFSSSFGTKLASFDFEIGDYFTISTDEYEVAFSFGIPLGGYTDDSTDVPGSGQSGFADTNKDNWDDMTDAVKKVADFIKNKDKNALAGDELDGCNLKSSNFEVKFSASLGFVFKYNALDNCYYFAEAGISFTAEMSYRYQYRFTPVPIVYVYVEVGVEAKISTGLGVNRDTVEGAIILQNSTTELKKPESGATTVNSYSFNTTKKAFNITFTGKLYMEAFEADGVTKLEGFTPGYISSDGSQKTQVVLVGKDGMDLGKTVKVVLSPIEDTTINRIAVIDSIYSDVYWNGVQIGIEAYIEAGAGVGVEIAKFELYAKMVVGIGFRLGTYDTETHSYSAGSFDEFKFQLGLGFRVVFLFFSYEMDLIEYHVQYERGEGWSHGYSAFGGAFSGDEPLGLDDESGRAEVTIRLPGNYTYSQTFYTNGVTGEISEQSVETDTYFDVSGYGTSSSGFKLFDGVGTGYDYKVITLGGENYLVYTVCRDNSDALEAEDYTALALSRIKLTADTDGNLSYGLVNPVNGGTNPSYILIDNDYTGDLDFSVWTEGNDTINVSWVSYKTQTDLSRPTVPAYSYGGETISAGNYLTITPAPEPIESDYYSGKISKEAYDLLDEEAQAAYKPDNPASPGYYYILGSGYETFAQASEAYQNALDTYESYTLWKNYYARLADTDSREAVASKNTEVKFASFTVGGTGFTAPAVISGAVTGEINSNYCFLPYGRGDKIVFGQTNSYPDINEQLDEYETYLTDAAGYDETIAKYRLQYMKTAYQTYGSGSRLNFAYNDSGWKISSAALSAGQILTNVEFTEIGSTLYVAYTTEQSTAVKSGANIVDWLTVSRLHLRTVSGEGEWGEPILVRTLYNYDSDNSTDRVDGIYSGGALKTQYKDPYFSNLQFLTGKLDSAMLTGGTSIDTQEVTNQTFLLFEMNGSTYIVDQDNLVSITGVGTGTVYPFFTPESLVTDIETGQTQEQSTTGKAEVTIGADGDGNIAAVYTSIVPNTTNNALFVSYYDPETGTWGDGMMLAMMHMGVYEASIMNGWDSKTTEAAYYDEALGGGMDQFTFSNLQIALGTSGSMSEQSLNTQDANGMVTATYTPPGKLVDYFGTTSGSLTTLSADDERALRALGVDTLSSTPTTLLIIAQGTYTELEKYGILEDDGTYKMNDDGSYQYMITKKKNTDPTVGIYAVSYGYGGQDVGNITLSFANNDFTAGAELYASLKFTNTGDTAIRYSKSGATEYPIDVKLFAYTGGTSKLLGSWTVDENIKAGQSVSLSGYLARLTNDLSVGDYFYITVSENEDYFGAGRYSFTSQDDAVLSNNIFVVADKPELGFESFEARAESVDGDNVTLGLNFIVSNRGNSEATGTYVQFTYDTGTTDSGGEPVYAPLPILSNDLIIDEQKSLSELDTLDVTDLANGIIQLTDEKGHNDIDPGYYRTVHGSITVPNSAFCGAVTGSLNLKVEVYSDSSITNYSSGVVISDHEDEYNTLNNYEKVQIEHTSFIAAAKNIIIPMGSTLRLPVAVTTTTGEEPELLAYEVEDVDGDELGILYYDDGAGAVVIMPSAVGEGVIHITDTATNTTHAVVYKVTEAGEGMNVIFENDYFTFYDKDGSIHAKPEDYSDWSFREQNTWGGNEYESQPYLRDLAVAAEGAYFTFKTQADELSFIFDGMIEVTVTDPGGDPVALKNQSGHPLTYTTDGGDVLNNVLCVDRTETNADAKVFFDNVNQQTFTVKVKAYGGTAYIDTVKQEYSGTAPTPSDDVDAPGIYWGRVFPGTASIDSDNAEALTIKVYVLDDTGLASVTLDGKEPSIVIHDEGLWSFTFTVTENGNHTVKAMDYAGNNTARTITVDWFSSTTDPDSTSFAPDLTATLYKVSSGGAKTEITDSVKISAAEYSAGVYASITADSSESAMEYTVYYYDANARAFSSVVPEADGTFRAATNGYYRVVGTYIGGDMSDPKYGTWSSVILSLDAYDTTLPVVSLTDLSTAASGTGKDLAWSAYKQSGGTIAEVSINGDTIYKYTAGTKKTSLSGTYNVSYGAVYTLTATDSANNVVSFPLDVSMPVDVSADGVFTTVGSYDQADSSGKIIISFSRDGQKLVIGGDNANEAAVSPQEYYGSYEFAVVPKEESFSGDTDGFGAYLGMLDWDPAAYDDVITITGLTSGDYVVYVRDAKNPNDESLVATQELTVADEIVRIISSTTRNASTVAQDANDGIINITATNSGTGTYQYAIKPLTLASGATNDVPVFDTTYEADEFTDWAPGYNTFSFKGLSTGWYQIAARTMYGVDTSDMDELYELAYALEAAETELDNIEYNIAANTAAAAANLNLLYQAWQDAVDTGGDAASAYSAYTDAFGNDADILDALDEWLEAAQAAEDYLDSHGEADPALTAATNEKREAYNRAVEEYFTAYYTASSGQAEAEAAYDTALGNYNARLTALNAIAAGAYEATPDYWDGVYTETYVYLGYDTPVSFTPNMIPASTTSTADGKILITNAEGGAGGTYLFALLPLVEPVLYTKTEVMNMEIEWQVADSADFLDTASFTGLNAGIYQAIVRPMYGVTPEDVRDLLSLRSVKNNAEAAYAKALDAASTAGIEAEARSIESLRMAWQSAVGTAKETEAETAYKNAIDSDATILELLADWQSADESSKQSAKEAYEAAVVSYLTTRANIAAAAAETVYETAYNTYYACLAGLNKTVEDRYRETPGCWNNMLSKLVTVDTVSVPEGNQPDSPGSGGGGGSGGGSGSGSGTGTEEDTDAFTFEDGEELSEEDVSRIIGANQEGSVILRTGTLTIIIPEGTLSEGDDVNDLIPDTKNIGRSNVVAYTDKNGIVHTVILSNVENGKATFVVTEPGRYFLEGRDGSFSDTQGHWAEEEIEFAVVHGLFAGTGINTFSPDIPMTRSMLVTVLYRLAGQPGVEGSNVYSDVEDGTWYTDAVIWAAGEGIVSGYGDSIFGTNDIITRQDMVTILWRYMQYMGYDTDSEADLSMYDDAGSIAQYARSAMSWAVSIGLVSGTTNSALSPGSSASRAQVATIYARLINYLLNSMS